MSLGRDRRQRVWRKRPDISRPVIPEVANKYFTGDYYSDPYWRIFRISSLTKMSPAALEDIVREKEDESRQYKKCDAYGLLVIVDWGRAVPARMSTALSRPVA
jgi:hypothetical protein